MCSRDLHALRHFLEQPAHITAPLTRPLAPQSSAAFVFCSQSAPSREGFSSSSGLRSGQAAHGSASQLPQDLTAPRVCLGSGLHFIRPAGTTLLFQARELDGMWEEEVGCSVRAGCSPSGHRPPPLPQTRAPVSLSSWTNSRPFSPFPLSVLDCDPFMPPLEVMAHPPHDPLTYEETGQPTWCGTTTCVSAVFTPGQAVWARLARRLPSCQGRCGCSWRPEPIPGRLGVSVLPPVNQGRLLPSQALGSFPGSFPPVQFPRPRIPVSDSFLAVMPRARDTPAEACAGPLPPPQDSLSPSGYQAEGNSHLRHLTLMAQPWSVNIPAL